MALPLKFTTAPLTNPVPFTVSVNADPPAVALEGASDVIVGGGLVTAKFVDPEEPPPGAGLVTDTGNVPTAKMSAAVTWIVTCVALTNEVVRAVPLKLTTEEPLKLVPFTVNVNADPPTNAPVGESVVIVGTGLLIVNAEFPEAAPPGVGLATLTLTVPAAAISAAVTWIVTCVALTNVVVRAVPLNVTVAPETKFVPFTASVNAAPPAVALFGESVVITGTGLFTEKV